LCGCVVVWLCGCVVVWLCGCDGVLSGDGDGGGYGWLRAGLPAAHAEQVASLWRGQVLELSRTAISATLTVNELVDMEWKFGVTVGTDEIEKVSSCVGWLRFLTHAVAPVARCCVQMGATFLQLRMVIDKGSGVRENVLMELSLPQFYDFLSQMEKAKTFVDFLAGSA
jgi:hypothetical protein